MKCVNCGSLIEENSKECSECGTKIEESKKEIIRRFIPKNDFDFKNIFFGCFKFILGVFLKPVSYLKLNINDYSDIRKTGILVLFVSFLQMILNLFSRMVSIIFMREIDVFTGVSKLTVSFGRLKNLNYFDLIFKNFFGFIIVTFAIAGIYYFVSLIMKKTTDYFKLVAITTVSFIPLILASTILSLIISYIYVPASLFLVVGGFIYSLFTFINGINNEINFDDSNFLIYFHSICLTIVFIISYYIFGSSFSLLFGLFK